MLSRYCRYVLVSLLRLPLCTLLEQFIVENTSNLNSDEVEFYD